MCVNMCVYVCVDVEARGCSFFGCKYFKTLSILLLETGSLTVLEFTDLARQLASELQGSFSLCLLGSGITSIPPCLTVFHVASGN